MSLPALLNQIRLACESGDDRIFVVYMRPLAPPDIANLWQERDFLLSRRFDEVNRQDLLDLINRLSHRISTAASPGAIHIIVTPRDTQTFVRSLREANEELITRNHETGQVVLGRAARMMDTSLNNINLEHAAASAAICAGISVLTAFTASPTASSIAATTVIAGTAAAIASPQLAAHVASRVEDIGREVQEGILHPSIPVLRAGSAAFASGLLSVTAAFQLPVFFGGLAAIGAAASASYIVTREAARRQLSAQLSVIQRAIAAPELPAIAAPEVPAIAAPRTATIATQTEPVMERERSPPADQERAAKRSRTD